MNSYYCVENHFFSLIYSTVLEACHCKSFIFPKKSIMLKGGSCFCNVIFLWVVSAVVYQQHSNIYSHVNIQKKKSVYCSTTLNINLNPSLWVVISLILLAFRQRRRAAEYAKTMCPIFR